MKTAIEEIIRSYNVSTVQETKAALREILQSIVLVGLSRGGFFKKASFYGGTALRIFHGLNRYSEDLDFTLNEPDNDFSLEPYLKYIKEIGMSYGLELDISTKIKKVNTPIESAFAKLNTYQTFIHLQLNSEMAKLLHKDEIIKVKFEVDCNPPLGFKTENRWLNVPEFAPVSVLDEESLFSGKLHAILCRTYKNNVKGRDYYDFLFYISKGIKPNLGYLKNKLIESGHLKETEEFNMEILKNKLREKFENVDFDQVKSDAKRFLFRNEDLEYYCKELFIDMVNKI